MATGNIQPPVTQEHTGRPTKLTPELQERLCKLMREGSYLDAACQACGIHVSTAQKWKDRAEEAFNAENWDDPYLHFFYALKKAEAEAEHESVKLVRDLSQEKKDGYLAMTFLERRHRERWGRPAPIQIQQGDTKILNITHVEIELDEGGKPGKVIEGEARELLDEPE